MAQQGDDGQAVVRLPVGMIEIGPGHAVRARDVCEVEHDARSGDCLIGLDFSGRQADAESRLPYAEIMRRLCQAQRDECAEPGDLEVVHLLREALDQLPEERRTLLERTVRAAIGHAHQSLYPVSIGPDVLKELAGLKPGDAYDPHLSATADSRPDTARILAKGTLADAASASSGTLPDDATDQLAEG